MSRLFIIILSILILGSCSKEDIHRKVAKEDQINIYLVDAETVFANGEEVDLNSLVVNETPWLSYQEIDFYDWSSQIIYLKDSKDAKNINGRYFLLTIGDERFALGYFMPLEQSYIPWHASIITEFGFFSPPDVVSLNGYMHSGQEDVLESGQFLNALTKSNIYHRGIEIELLDIARKSSTTIEYTYRITNVDNHSIYVLDPDKMGSPKFHYYMNGVRLKDEATWHFAQNMTVESSESINDSWYYRLKAGKSKTWSVMQDGFTSLPNEYIKATLDYSGPSLHNEGEWRKNDGRIWLGRVSVSLEK